MHRTKFFCKKSLLYTVHYQDESSTNFWIGVDSGSKYPEKAPCKRNFDLKVSK